MVPSIPLLSCASSVSVKENPDRKKKKKKKTLLFPRYYFRSILRKSGITNFLSAFYSSITKINLIVINIEFRHLNLVGHIIYLLWNNYAPEIKWSMILFRNAPQWCFISSLIHFYFRFIPFLIPCSKNISFCQWRHNISCTFKKGVLNEGGKLWG